MHKVTQHIVEHWSHLKQYQLFVAVSGGVDSLSLLYALHTLQFEVSAIHVNYQLRGKDSDEDAHFIAQFCQEYSIPFQQRIHPISQQLKAGGNLQAVARDVRYDWFYEILNAHESNRVLLAHHLDDQTETFFSNVGRKSGVMGLAGMKSEHNGIVRPFLTLQKQDLIDYLTTHTIPWREDASNATGKYQRNRLRNTFLPFVRKEIPSIDDSVSTLTALFQSLQETLEQRLQPFVEEVQKNKRIDIAAYTGFDSHEKVEFLRQLGVKKTLTSTLDDLAFAMTGKQLHVNGTWFSSIVKDRDQFTFLSGEYSVPELHLTSVEQLPTSFSKSTIYLDKHLLKGDLNIRVWKLGDRISPIGMKGSQLISDIIKDAKLSTAEKQRVMVVHDDEHIHWCIGLKVGRLAIAHPSSSEILACSIS